MLQLLWNMFEKTGQINTYMFYKALERADMEEKNETEVPGVLDGDTVFGGLKPLEEQA